MTPELTPIPQPSRADRLRALLSAWVDENEHSINARVRPAWLDLRVWCDAGRPEEITEGGQARLSPGRRRA